MVSVASVRSITSSGDNNPLPTEVRKQHGIVQYLNITA